MLAEVSFVQLVLIGALKPAAGMLGQFRYAALKPDRHRFNLNTFRVWRVRAIEDDFIDALDGFGSGATVLGRKAHGRLAASRSPHQGQISCDLRD